MRWALWRRRRGTASPEAQAAKERASKALADTRSQAYRVTRVSDYLQAEGVRNHWSERLAEGWRGVPDT